MSGAVASSAALMVGGMVVAKMMAPKMPDIPAPPAPPPPPQASVAPDTRAIASNLSGTGQAGGGAGVASTMLTGAGGVNPNKLDLNKTTLLGS